MKIYYYDDKKEKGGSHEIQLEHSEQGGIILYNIEISLSCYDGSKEEVLQEFLKDRVDLSKELRRLADEIESIDVDNIKEK